MLQLHYEYLVVQMGAIICYIVQNNKKKYK